MLLWITARLQVQERPTLQCTRVATIILLWISKTVIHEKGLLQVVCSAFTSRWKVYYKSTDLGAWTAVFFLPDSMHQAVCPDTPHRQQNHPELGDIHHNGNQIQSLLVHSQFLICVPHDSNQELQQSTNIFRNIHWQLGWCTHRVKILACSLTLFNYLWRPYNSRNEYSGHKLSVSSSSTICVQNILWVPLQMNADTTANPHVAVPYVHTVLL